MYICTYMYVSIHNSSSFEDLRAAAPLWLLYTPRIRARLSIGNFASQDFDICLRSFRGSFAEIYGECHSF